jgi:hypothetical protein
MQFITHKDPVHDLGGTSNVRRKPFLLRRLISATRCAVLGHSPDGTGHANGHKYSSTEWQIGAYSSCKSCQARIFNLHSKEQFETVLSIELLRWHKFFAEKKNNKSLKTKCPARHTDPA